jgi:hypothetical protein
LLFLSSLTRSAYLNVFKVCSQQLLAGETLAIIVVLLLPVKESFNTYVSLLPLNGKCFFSRSNALIHSFNANRLLLISAPSNLVYLLVLIVSAPLSLPAKSMKLILLYGLPLCFNYIYKIACDLLLSELAPVLPLVLLVSPVLISFMMSSTWITLVSVKPTIFTFYFASSLQSTSVLLLSKS